MGPVIGLDVAKGESQVQAFLARKLTVRVNVRNVGDRAGKEIIQLYVRDVKSSVIRPEKELKGFEKTALQQNEEKTVTFVLDKRSFAHYGVRKRFDE